MSDWWRICLALGVMLGLMTFAGLGVWKIDQHLAHRYDHCYKLFDGNVIGEFCPIAEFRERPPVAP